MAALGRNGSVSVCSTIARNRRNLADGSDIALPRLRNCVKSLLARRLHALDHRQRIRCELIGGAALRLSALLSGLVHMTRIAELHALSRANRVAKTLLLDRKRRRYHRHVAGGRVRSQK